MSEAPFNEIILQIDILVFSLVTFGLVRKMYTGFYCVELNHGTCVFNTYGMCLQVEAGSYLNN